MTKNAKITLTVVFAAAAALLLALLLARPSPVVPQFPAAADSPAPVVPADILVRENSHRLSTAPDGKATFVEFLDFECEACGAVYPAVEQLRTEYAGRVTFIARYYPIPSHVNAENAALSVEAAAAQGRFVDMYQRMYETQTAWAEQQESRASVFRGFAVELGLDMDAYDRAIADPATLQRVQDDRRDGDAAGVQGTPTFFLNGVKLEPQSIDDLRIAIDDALSR